MVGLILIEVHINSVSSPCSPSDPRMLETLKMQYLMDHKKHIRISKITMQGKYGFDRIQIVLESARSFLVCLICQSLHLCLKYFKALARIFNF